MKGLLAIGVVSMLVVIGIFAYERMLWKECRHTNSWFYCIRVLESH